MISVRHFYFFICVSILFFFSLQNDDENPESSTNTSGKKNNKSETEQCIKDITVFRDQFMDKFENLQRILISSKFPERGLGGSFMVREARNFMRHRIQEYNEKMLNFCKVLWLRCYDGSIETMLRKRFSVKDEKFVRIPDELCATCEVDEIQKDFVRMIYGLKMVRCDVEEGTEIQSFYFSLIEEDIPGKDDENLHFFLFEGEEHENKVKVKLYAYTSIYYNAKKFKKQLKMKKKF